MPQRIQRKRTPGWRMPPNTVYVGRPTGFGNPFTVYFNGRQGAVDGYREQVCLGRFVEGGTPGYLRDINAAHTFVKQNIGSLRGKNLACWCPLDQPCHADVLLELANA